MELLLILIFELLLNSISSFTVPPQTVKELNVTAYLGRWYQMYASIIPNQTFERNGFCVTADYVDPVIDTDGEIFFTVINSQTVGSPNGTVSQAIGIASNENFNVDPGKFRVSFTTSAMSSAKSVLPFSLFSPFSKSFSPQGFYWIIDVGDIDTSTTNQLQQYPWAIVSTPFQLLLFVLARDVDEFRSKYEEKVLDRVADLGFTSFFNKPLETFQSSSPNSTSSSSEIDLEKPSGKVCTYA